MPWIQSRRVRIGVGVAIAVALFGLAALATPAHLQDWPNRFVVGATITQPRKEAPVFINTVWAESPADRAGITSGSRLLAIDGVQVIDLREAAKRMSSDKPGSVTLRLWRRGQTYEVTLEREKMSSLLQRTGKKITPQGLMVPLDATQADVERITRFDPGRIEARAFPEHVPLDPDVFCAGFEVFILRESRQIMVGGLEAGPGERAGLRWGDLILAIDEIDPKEKTATEIEAMLSGDHPRAIHLKIERLGTIKTVEFTLEKNSQVLKRNQRQLIQGKLVPAGLADEDLKWFISEHE